MGFGIEGVDKVVLARKVRLVMPARRQPFTCPPPSSARGYPDYKPLCSVSYLSFSPIENPHLSLFVQNHAYSHCMFSSLLFQKQRPSRGCLFSPGSIALFSKTKPIPRMWENQKIAYMAIYVPFIPRNPKPFRKELWSSFVCGIWFINKVFSIGSNVLVEQENLPMEIFDYVLLREI
jgi:hypothetical protein